jgi:hypothetical protein
MGWRDKYKVHPAADVFPMMDDAELAALGEDIKKNGQSIPILCWGKEEVLIDGRNRLEAMERIGIADQVLAETFYCKDPVTHIITFNIRRRHLTKQQQADLIVAAVKAGAEASRQVGEVPKRHTKGKAGSEKDAVKAAAVAAGAEHGISKRTVERAIAKAEGKTPRPTPPLDPKPGQGALHKLDAARGHYLECVKSAKDLDGELDIIRYAFREIAGNRAMASQKRADGRSDDGMVRVCVKTVTEPSTEPISVHVKTVPYDVPVTRCR